MRSAAFMFILALIIFGLVAERPGDAQNRSPARRQPSTPQTTYVRSADLGTPEEQAKIIEACSVGRGPRPEVEGMKTYSLLCGKAISLPKPIYPAEAKAEKISGPVSVLVVIDEKGRVIWAEAVKGHALLKEASVNAACRARYSPLKISGRAVKAMGFITYNFVSE